jgi:hypothetical protein
MQLCKFNLIVDEDYTHELHSVKLYGNNSTLLVARGEGKTIADAVIDLGCNMKAGEIYPK